MPDDKPQAPVREGEIIAGKYIVERVLGVGGMGVVVAARHIELGELFALKFLLPNVGANAEVTKRFAREARTGIRVKNEHVARVYDVGTLPDGAPFMVMEHLTGEDFATLLERRGFLPVAEAVDLLLQACEALCEAHHIGIVHRDLKPANLFVVAGSDGLPFVKVLDFGISKHVGSDDLSVTSSAAVLGSPLYMSPEQLKSSKDADRRSDLWSLGVILYEAITGATPFQGASFPELCVAIMMGKFEPASTLRAGIPPQVDAILASLLKSERDARLPSVDLLARRLAPFGTAQGRMSSERITRIASRPGPSGGALPELRAPSPSSPSTEVGNTRAVVIDPPAPAVTAPVDPKAAPAATVVSRGRGTRPLLAVGVTMLTVGVVGAWAVLRATGVTHTEPRVSGAPAALADAAPVALAPSEPPATVSSPTPSAPVASAIASPASSPPPEVAHDHPATGSAATPKQPAAAPAIVALTSAFRRRQGDVTRCLEEAADPPAVSISIRFTVGVDGHVKAAQVFPPEVGSTPVGLCLATVARGTEFGTQSEEVSFRIPIATRH